MRSGISPRDESRGGLGEPRRLSPTSFLAAPPPGTRSAYSRSTVSSFRSQRHLAGSHPSRSSQTLRVSYDPSHDDHDIRGGQSVRSYLEDLRTDPKEIVVPFSCPQIGIYYDVLLAGTEHLRRKKASALAIVQHESRRALASTPLWEASPEYLLFRRKCREQPDTTLNLVSEEALLRCPTPPPAECLPFETESSTSSDRSTESETVVSFEDTEPVSKWEPPTILDPDYVYARSFCSFKTSHRDGETPVTDPLAEFAREIECGLRQAAESKLVRRRIRHRKAVAVPPSPDTADLPDLHYVPTSAGREFLVSPIEEEYIMQRSWTCRGAYTLAAPRMTLQQAWDIGKKGCYGKVTFAFQNVTWPPPSSRRFLLMDGTSDGSLCFVTQQRSILETFLTIYSGGDNDMRYYEFPERLLTISWLEMQDAEWNDLQTSVHLTTRDPTCHVRIEALPTPFYCALITCLRFNYASRILSQIRRRRFFIRQFDVEEGHLKALQSQLLAMKLLTRLRVDGLENFPDKDALNPRDYVPTGPPSDS